jgi:hypothetical protein
VVSGDVDSMMQSLGISRGFNPLPPERARWVWLGLKGVGKTHLICDCPRTLVLDFEDSCRNVANSRADYVAINSYAHLQKVLQMLQRRAQTGSRPYDQIVFDPLDSVQEMVGLHLTQKKKEENTKLSDDFTIYDYGREGKGWKLVALGVAALVLPVFRWGYGWSCTCHLQWTTTKELRGGDVEEIEHLRPSCSPGVFKLIKHETDYVCQLGWTHKKREHLDPNTKARRYTNERVVVMAAQNTPKTKKDAELSYRVPLPPLLEIPYKTPWSAVQRAWEAGKAQRLAEL